MTEQDVKVSFSIAVPRGALVPEAEAVSWFAANPAGLIDAAAQEGVILIEGGGEELPIGDVVLWMIPALCFDGVKAVLGTGKAVFDAFSNDTHAELQREGESITVTCRGEFPLTLPAAPLLAALFAAGERFVTLFGQLWPERADALLADIHPRASAARASLAGP